MKTLSQEVLNVLSSVSYQGNEVHITTGQLDRKVYLQVNEVLESLGGKWNRKRRAHVFEGDSMAAFDALDQVLCDGGWHDKRRDLGQFPTPPELARRIVSLAGVKGKKVLEPSCGRGALVFEAVRQGAERVWCIEIDPQAALALADETLKMPESLEKVVCRVGSFLAFLPNTSGPVSQFQRADRVVMNPPFARGADVLHVLHALQWLAEGGVLVSVMSAGVTFRQDKVTASFRASIAAAGGTIEELPEGSFRESGTDVRTVLVTVRKGRG